MFKPPGQKLVKYRTIRLREEVALVLDEWQDVFEDASKSEVLWRMMSLAKRELRRVTQQKKRAREKYMRERKKSESVGEIVSTLDVRGNGNL